MGEESRVGPFPAVVHMHGGPVWVETNGFSPEGQAWLDHGFAYMSVNYRGSSLRASLGRTDPGTCCAGRGQETGDHPRITRRWAS